MVVDVPEEAMITDLDSNQLHQQPSLTSSLPSSAIYKQASISTLGTDYTDVDQITGTVPEMKTQPHLSLEQTETNIRHYLKIRLFFLFLILLDIICKTTKNGT